MKVRNFVRFSLKLLHCKARAQKGNMQIHGMAYNGLVDPRALHTLEAPEDATQGVYRLSHAI